MTDTRETLRELMSGLDVLGVRARVTDASAHACERDPVAYVAVVFTGEQDTMQALHGALCALGNVKDVRTRESEG